MGTLLQDLRYGVRMLVKNPVHTAAAVLCLALGIGANTAIFSVTDALLLRPLPGIEAPASLVTLGRTDSNSGFDTFSYPDYVDYREQNRVFAGLAAHFSTPLHLSTGGGAERVAGTTVSGNYFDVLGVHSELGRLLSTADDQQPGAHPVAVISYGLWQRRFGSDPSIVGREVLLNGYSFTVVGVAAKAFAGADVGDHIDVWLPMRMQAQAKPVDKMLTGLDVFGNRSFVWLDVFGRLKPGVDVSEARAQMGTLADGLAAAYPDTNKGRGVAIAPGIGLDPETRAGWSGFMKTLMAVVSLVLLIACANVANLLLARGTARRKELGIRLALGASRRRLVRQLLTESLLLSAVGGGFGLLGTFWIADLLPSLFAPTASFALDLDLRPDARLLGFTLIVSVATGIVFGLVPALHASKLDLAPVLKEATTTGRGISRSRARSVLVITQVAVSLVLLIGAGLFIRTLWNTRAVNPGFDTDNVIISSLDLGLQGYGEAEGRVFYDGLIKRVETLPGVGSVSLARMVPLGGGGMGMPITVEGREAPPDGSKIQVTYNIITPGYFQTMNVPVVRGRDFSEQDTSGARRVTIINETIARQLFPGEDPLGKRLIRPRGMGKTEAVEIVGIVKDIKYRSLLGPPQLYLYLPMQYEPVMTLHVRMIGDPAAIAAAVRSEVQQLDKNLPVYGVMTLAERLRGSIWRQRTAATLVGLCGLVALALASIGIYGVMSYTVAERTHEIGIRMALGARTGDVLWMMVRQGMTLIFVGAGLGLAAALILTRLVASQLYGVSATDPVTFLGAALLLALIALLACYIPARRATKVDPMVALRYE